MKVLVTGATGFLGQHIVERLVKEGINVFALVRRRVALDKWLSDNANCIICDLRDKKELEKSFPDVDVVVHAAITFSGDWNNFYKVNVEATKNLLDWSAKHKVKRFIYISSVSIYKHKNLKNNQNIAENFDYEDEKDTTFYSRSKIEAEKIIKRLCAERDLGYVILRPGAIYGPRGELFPATIGLPIGSDKILMFGNSKTNLPLSYVENVADIVYKSLYNTQALGECFNLVEDKSLTRKEYLRVLKTEVDSKILAIKVPFFLMCLFKACLKTVFGLLGRKAPLGDLNLRMFCSTFFYNNEKTKRIFGAEPFVNFEESLKRTSIWHHQKFAPPRSNGLKGKKVVLPSRGQAKVGIIGCGYIASIHLYKLKKMRCVNLVAVADPNEQALNNISNKYKIPKKYPSYREMLQAENLEVVHILAPPQYHAEMAEEAAKAKCHIYVEKPMAVDVNQAAKMVKAAQDNSVKLCVGHNFLYNDVMLTARNIISRGKLGQIVNVESWYGTNFGPSCPPFNPSDHWIYNMPGSIYHDFMSHPLYLLLDIMKDVQILKVFAKSASGVPLLKTDELRIMVENRNSFGLLTFSLTASPAYHNLNIYGTKGSLKIDFLNNTVLLHKNIGVFPPTLSRTVFGTKEAINVGFNSFKISFDLIRGKFNYFNGLERLIQLFYRSILLNEPVPASGEEGLNVVQYMDKIWVELNSPVK